MQDEAARQATAWRLKNRHREESAFRYKGEWTHHFSPKWSLTANAAFATKYFPDITADVALRHYLKNDWEIGAHVGYRRVAAYTKRYEWNDEFFAGGTGDNGYLFTGWNESKTNLLTVGGELAKTIEVVRLNTKIDMHFFNSNFYYNAQIGAKYFPANDGKTNINAMASIGSATGNGRTGLCAARLFLSHQYYGGIGRPVYGQS